MWPTRILRTTAANTLKKNRPRYLVQITIKSQGKSQVRTYRAKKRNNS